jgi:hypothetical protein
MKNGDKLGAIELFNKFKNKWESLSDREREAEPEIEDQKRIMEAYIS